MLPYGYEIEIQGLVQGVGFRPFVYNLAKKSNLCGEVYNDTKALIIKLSCNEEDLKKFLNKLQKNKPQLSRIDEIKIKKIKCSYNDFCISESKINTKSSAMLSDFAICSECKKEFYDEKNSRFMYPFTTCTQCGVRFSIIKSLPYDRKNTSMSSFELCKSCQNEYKDPLNRRFHAQPLSCPKCKINIFLKDKNQNILFKDKEAVKQATSLLNNGKILAFKGLGGFHLMCDALNLHTLKELRLRKKRAKKPLAIMCKNLEMAQSLAFINEKEAEILESKEAPILILKAKKELELISFDSDKIGIMLAYTPLHLLLFEYFKKPLVATSANLSGESIISNEKDLLDKLSCVFDFYVDYDRDIVNSSDDSIAQVVNDELMYLRTSRGKRPQYIKLDDNFQKKKTLALGAELKNEFALCYDDKILLSPYMGDMKSIDVQKRAKKLIDFFIKTYELEFDYVLADKHPHFSYTKPYKANAFIQHHYAHACAVMFEHKIYTKSIVFCFDGTGYGDDAKIWGGEILKADLKSYERIAHFSEFKLINTDIKNIQNLVLSLIFKWNLEDNATKFLEKIDEKKLRNLKKIYSLSEIHTSSLGRIIDAFYALAFGEEKLDFEAQAGLCMEKFYDFKLDYTYHFEMKQNTICFKEAFLQALNDDKIKICTGFLNALANFIYSYSKEFLKQNKDIKDVILCGGVFQNSTLLKILKIKGLNYKTGLKFPVNDSSIALGQIAHFLKK